VDNVPAMAESQHRQESLEDPGQVPAIQRGMLLMHLFEGVKTRLPSEHIDLSRELSGGRKRVHQRRQVVSVGGIARNTQQRREGLPLDVQRDIAFGTARYLQEIKRLRSGVGFASGRGEIEGTRTTLVKPQTFMNLSGHAVACLLAKIESESPIEQLVVISDDLA